MTPTDENPIVLRSERLTVEIAAPGSVYDQSRFDWTAFITQVTLEGEAGAHTFCVPEDYRPGQGTGGSGICNEFGIDAPIGFTGAKPGELFPKLGIGLLKRTESQDYSFYLPYEIVERFPIRVEASPERVEFMVEPIECRGYAARLTKTVSVHENQLNIDYKLENTGRELIETNEYVHNFMGIDQQPMGPDYRLRFPYSLQIEAPRPLAREAFPRWMRWLPGSWLDKLGQDMLKRFNRILEIDENELTLRFKPKASFYCRPLGFGLTQEPQWALKHKPSGLEVSESDDFAPSRVAVWGAPHVISAEVFAAVNVPPGGTQTWQRHYEFSEKV